MGPREGFKKRRRFLGYTLRRFCLEHNLDAVIVSQIERGIHGPTLEDQMRLLDALLSCERALTKAGRPLPGREE